MTFDLKFRTKGHKHNIMQEASTVHYMKSTHLHYYFARIVPFHWNVLVGLACLVLLDHFILHNDRRCC